MTKVLKKIFNDKFIFSNVGKVILEAVILTNVVVLSLTLYTSWAAKRCYDFSFLAPFLIGALLVHILFNLIKVFCY